MKRKKILYLITKSNWGGAQVYLYSLVSSLPRNQYDITVVHGSDGLLNKKLKEIKIKTIEINKLNRNIKLLDEIKVFFKLFKIFKKEKPDIIHLNSSKIGGLGAFVGRVTGVKKIIFTAHGWPFNEDRPMWQKIFILILSYVTTFLAHKTITVAKKEYDQAKKWFLVNKKIELIHNGISKIDFLNREEARNFLINNTNLVPNADNNTVWIGTISELTKNKGLEYAIKALRELQKSLNKKWNIIFIIIGDGENKKDLKYLINKEGLEESVFLIGFIQDANKYLKAFDIFLLSSIKEGFPYALLEAGQAGNAVISTQVGGTGEIIDNLENGILIHSKREKEISNAIRFYLENPKKINQFGDKLKNKVIEKFSVEKMIEKTFNLYK